MSTNPEPAPVWFDCGDGTAVRVDRILAVRLSSMTIEVLLGAPTGCEWVTIEHLPDERHPGYPYAWIFSDHPDAEDEMRRYYTECEAADQRSLLAEEWAWWRFGRVVAEIRALGGDPAVTA